MWTYSESIQVLRLELEHNRQNDKWSSTNKSNGWKTVTGHKGSALMFQNIQYVLFSCGVDSSLSSKREILTLWKRLQESVL